jgi:hypothetical protein
MSHRIRAHIGLAAFALLATACTDRLPTTAEPPVDGGTSRTLLTCTATVQQPSLRCEEAPDGGGAAQNIIIGGQGTYVRLASSNPSYDGSSTFQVDVTVQNLLSQRMGTPDGTTIYGVKVFLASGPSASGGTGDVAVANPDGHAFFTAADQPYFAYPEILEARGTSAPREWRFTVPNTVTSFRFSVYVETQLPTEAGTLRWVQERGALVRMFAQLQSVWGTSAHNVFAVGGGNILHFDGSRWEVMDNPVAAGIRGVPARFLLSVSGSSARDVWAVGTSNAILKYDGSRWQPMTTPDGSRRYEGVWSDGERVFAVGAQVDAGDRSGLIARSEDGGATWDTTLSPSAGNRVFYDVWSSGDHVYAAGYESGVRAVEDAVILRSADGGDTWQETVLPGAGRRNIWAVRGSGPDDVVVAGGEFNPATGLWEALVLHSDDQGDSWSETHLAGAGGRSVFNLFQAPWGEMYGAGYQGTLLRRDGSGWTDHTGFSTGSLQGIWGSSPSDLYIANFDFYYHWDGTEWTRTLMAPSLAVEGDTLRSVSGSGPESMFAAGNRTDAEGVSRGLILRRDGNGWRDDFVGGDRSTVEDVWSPAPDEAYAVGYTELTFPVEVWRYDGAGWARLAVPGPLTQYFNVVAGSSPKNVFLFGTESGSGVLVVRSTDGGASWTRTAVPFPEPTGPSVRDAWAAASNDVWAVGNTEHFPDTPAPFTMHYDGSEWKLTTYPEGSRRYFAVWSSGPHVFIAGFEPGEAGEAHKTFIRYSSNGGETWDESVVPEAQGLQPRGLWGTSPSNLYMATTGGMVLQFNGVSWHRQMAGDRADFLGIWGTSAEHVFAVGTGGSILHGTR